MVTFIIVLAGLGIINTLYLVTHVITKQPVACIGFPNEWCRKVQFSPYSKILGIPNPVLGLVMYCSLVVLGISFQQQLISFWPIGLVITFGFLFSLYFTYIQAFVLKAFCTWCVLSAIDFLILFIVTLLFIFS